MRQVRDAVVALLLVLGGALVGYQWCAAGHQVAESKPAALTPCAQEDSAGPCYWRAGERGDGRGTSFVVDGAQNVVSLPSGPTGPGGDWHPVTPSLAETLRAEGDAPDRATRDYAACWEHIGDTTYIVCPDGWVEGS